MNNSHREPIAIVGIGCRFPGGAVTPCAYWELLQNGVDAITETPPHRWSKKKFYHPDGSRPGQTPSKWGGFLDQINSFDPQFFGISPREAQWMDPQQRLLLEVAWEAIEDGGQTLERMSGSRTSVFVGISSWEHSFQVLSFRDRGIMDAYTNTGSSMSIAANRISYCFDFRGPSASVDTACSSSLVAVHLACRSIWNEQCPMALAGGVNALLVPDWYIGFSRLNMLSADGRCKAFDRRANGFVRSEGAGMVALKPLSRALEDGDRIYALIRGTSMNQDGRTPGMTVPRQEAQEKLLAEACRDAKIEPFQMQYVEAHGTGTPVGDPIEARALGAILGAGRPDDQPCIIGSVKTNIGHLEAGSGIASLIKTALALHHQQIPGNLHFDHANPDIDFAALKLRVPTGCESWPAHQGPLLAGVNSFGYGGTNAHVVLEGNSFGASVCKCDSRIVNPQSADPGAATHQAALVPLSARSGEALCEAAGAMRDFVNSSEDASLQEIVANSVFRRTHHDYRLAVVAENKQELAEKLAAHAERRAASGLAGSADTQTATGRVSQGDPPRLAYVCSGQGPQWWAMGRELLNHQPVFRRIIDRCDEVVRGLGDWSLLAELQADEAASKMAITAISQPCIFALQVALAKVLESWGIRPAAAVGHSVGEVAAAHLAGVFDLETAVRVIYQRGRCMELAPARGRMLAASLAPDEAQQIVAPYGEKAVVGAINGPSSVTLTGEGGALQEIADQLEQRQIFHRFLRVNYAFHSVQMEPIRDELLASLQGITPRTATLPLISTVTGELVEGRQMNAEYWWNNVRQAVRFAEGVAGLADLGCDTILELGPHPVLAASVAECYQQRGSAAKVLPTLRRGEPERRSLLASVGALYTLGDPIDWSGLTPRPRRFLQLPLYCWQRSEYRCESDDSRWTRIFDPDHPLLGCSDRGPRPSWHNRLDLRLFPYLSDHRVQTGVIFPAAGYVEIGLAAARRVFSEAGLQIENVKLLAPCFLHQEKPLTLATRYDPQTNSLETFSRVALGDDEWSSHSSIVLRGRKADEQPPNICLDDIRQRCGEEFAQEDCYPYFQSLGLHYGPAFQGLMHGRRRDGEAIAQVELPEAADDMLASGLAGSADTPAKPDEDYLFHPALMDACFHVAIPADPQFGQTPDGLYLPAEIDRIRFYQSPGRSVWCHARIREKTSLQSIADLDVYNEDGELLLEVRGLRSRRVAGSNRGPSVDELLYAYQWRQWDKGAEANHPNGKPEKPVRWLLFADSADSADLASLVANRLRKKGDECVFASAGEQFVQVKEDHYLLDPANRDDMVRLIKEFLDTDQERNVGVIHLWSLDAPVGPSLETAAIHAAQQPGVLSVLHLTQAWNEIAGQRNASLFLVTRGAQSVGKTPQITAVAQSPMVGMGRVLVSEFPRFECRLVDLDPAAGEKANAACLGDEIQISDGEDEVGIRDGLRYVHRYERLDQTERPMISPCEEEPFRLATRGVGDLDDLAWRTLKRRPPAEGKVEIQVSAAALNFSDVMKGLGIYPGMDDGPAPLGAECSGVITAVGKGPIRDAGGANLAVGDEVLAVAPFAFGSHVNTQAELTARKPPQISHQAAATIPIAFLTASYALDYLARLERGERVLIHSATGGVGMAAMQLARRTGAEIFATAGTPQKRDLLRDLGVEHIMDSRSVSFADEVLDRTGGEGVDVILNSLPGEAIPRGIEVLAENGRFLEIGKRDIYGNSQLGLRPFRRNLSFFAIDLDRVMRQRPERLGRLLEQLLQEFQDGILEPLPYREFSTNQVVEAFRWMQHGKHTGKIVVSMNEPPDAIAPNEEEEFTLRPDASYLITGGLGGFGRAVAQWMIERGAKSLVLVSRRGMTDPTAQQTISELQQHGDFVRRTGFQPVHFGATNRDRLQTCPTPNVKVTVMQADIADENQVADVVAQIDQSLPPLAGVIHAAMVLEDGLLMNLDRNWMERVMNPKVCGSWNLHRQMQHKPLDFFVLFSSLSSVFGHAGQANYAAANSFLDLLSYHRRARGLPCLTINWGYLGDVGYLAEREELGERLVRQGVLSFTSRQALACMEKALVRRLVQVSVMNVDWSRWRGLGVTGQVSPRFARLLDVNATHEMTADPSGLPSPKAMREAAPQTRREMVESLLRDKIARVLGASADQLDSQTPLLNLGLDSLMAVELRNWIESELEVNLPIVDLMRKPSLSRVAELVCGEIDQQREQPALAATEKPASPAELLEKIDDLSGQEVDDLLTELIAEKSSADS